MCLTPESTSRALSSLAGFQVTLIGRFWLTPEGLSTPQMFSLNPYTNFSGKVLGPTPYHLCPLLRLQ